MDLRALLDQQERAAQANFRGWIAWYMDTYPDTVPTRTVLAKLLDVTGGAVTQFLDPNRSRSPSLRTLLAAKKLTGMQIDVLLGPPPARARPTQTK